MTETLQDLVASFLRHLRAQGRAPRTGELYAQSLRFYSDWLAAQGQEATLDNFTREHVSQWLASLLDSGREPSTVAARFRGLRRFANWLVAEEIIDKSPLAGMSPPQAPQRPVPLLSDDELRRLLRACHGRGFNERRDEAIFRVLIDTGIRVSELCGLTVDTVDLDAEMAIVEGKGSKRRAVYLSPKTVAALDRYERLRRRHRYAHEPALFLGKRGPLTPDGIRQICELRAEQAGLGRRVHPHMFRHTAAHWFLLHGGNERDLKRLMGWSSDAMLETYATSGADYRAREAVKRMRPGDRV